MSYRVIAFDPDRHRVELLRLWRENLRDERIGAALEQRYQWFLHENPAGPPLIRLVEHVEAGTMIGCGAAYARPVLVAGKKLRAGVLSDFAIDRAHRVAGPAVMMQRALAQSSREHGFDFLYGYPNKGGEGVFLRVGHKKLGADSGWVKPLHTATKLSQRVPAPLARTVAPLVDAALWANDMRLLVARPLSLRANTRTDADSWFDDLWARTAPEQRVAGIRSAAFLRWRYVAHPTRSCNFFCVSRRTDGAPVGYVAFHRQGSTALVDDCWCADRASLTEALLLRFAAEMRRQGADVVWVTVLGAESLVTSLRAVGFHLRPGVRPMVVYADKHLPPSLRDTVLSPNAWSMFDGELDI